MPAVRFEPKTSQSLSGGVTPSLVHRLNPSPTEHCFISNVIFKEIFDTYIFPYYQTQSDMLTLLKRYTTINPFKTLRFTFFATNRSQGYFSG